MDVGGRGGGGDLETVRRVNQLVRQEEEEEAWWEDNKNNNLRSASKYKKKKEKRSQVMHATAVERKVGFVARPEREILW